MTTLEKETTRHYELSGWDLSELLPEPTESIIAARLDTLERDVAAFEAARDQLQPEMDPALLIDLMRRYETMVEQVQVLGAYGGLWFAAETQSAAALTYRNRMQQTLTNVQNRTLFFDLWWKSLSDDEAAALLPSAERYADYRHH